MLVLTDEIKTAINASLADGAPILMAAMQTDGQPWISIRGSAHTHSDDQIGLWIRNAEGHSAAGVGLNDRVSLFYRKVGGISFQMLGRARMVDDPGLRQRVYDESPEAERNADKEMKGSAMIVDLDKVIQRGRVILARNEADLSA